MNERLRTITRDGQPEYAVLPYDDYEMLLDAAETADDIAVHDRAKASADAERVPGQIMRRLVDGESPVKVRREYRGLDRDTFAERLGVSGELLIRIEAGETEGTLGVFLDLSGVLGVSLDELTGRRDRQP